MLNARATCNATEYSVSSLPGGPLIGPPFFLRLPQRHSGQAGALRAVITVYGADSVGGSLMTFLFLARYGRATSAN